MSADAPVFLLDISTLLALLVEDHEFFDAATAWADGKKLAVCPLAELGFLRVSMSAYNSTQAQARAALASFFKTEQPQFVAADISAITVPPFKTARQSTDFYLAALAEHHGMKLATFDGGIKHPAAVVIESENPAGE